MTLLATALICLGLMLPRTQSASQRVLYVLLAVLLSATVVLIRDLDLPFSGSPGCRRRRSTTSTPS